MFFWNAWHCVRLYSKFAIWTTLNVHCSYFKQIQEFAEAMFRTCLSQQTSTLYTLNNCSSLHFYLQLWPHHSNFCLWNIYCYIWHLIHKNILYNTVCLFYAAKHHNDCIACSSILTHRSRMRKHTPADYLQWFKILSKVVFS